MAKVSINSGIAWERLVKVVPIIWGLRLISALRPEADEQQQGICQFGREAL
jgi:hypothetical protein